MAEHQHEIASIEQFRGVMDDCMDSFSPDQLAEWAVLIGRHLEADAQVNHWIHTAHAQYEAALESRGRLINKIPIAREHDVLAVGVTKPQEPLHRGKLRELRAGEEHLGAGFHCLRDQWDPDDGVDRKHFTQFVGRFLHGPGAFLGLAWAPQWVFLGHIDQMQRPSPWMHTGMLLRAKGESEGRMSFMITPIKASTLDMYNPIEEV